MCTLAASISRFEKPIAVSRSKFGAAMTSGIELQRVAQKVFAKSPLVEGELDVEGGGKGGFGLLQRFIGKTFCLQRGDVDRGGVGERAVADGIGLDLGDIALAVAERAQRFGHSAVDDLPVAAAGELLELYQRKVGLDAGGVAIHHEANGAGRRHHGGLRVAETADLAELERLVPGGFGMFDQILLLAGGVIERHRVDGEPLIAAAFAVGGAAVVADHAEHVAGVLLVAGEGAELLCHFGRGRIADAGHDRSQGAAQRAAFLEVVGQTHGHQQAADIGKAEAERAELVGEFGDRL